MIEVQKRGMLTTVQDAGRSGYQRFGMPVAGAMDQYALALANILVGNPRDTAALEATISGPQLCFRQANIFAISGGDFAPTLNGKPISNNHAYLASAGDLLQLGFCRAGARAYIAFSGGLDGDLVMGSRSTYVKGRIGGVQGRALQDGDQLNFLAPQTSLPNLPFRFVDRCFGIEYSPHPTLGVTLGPQDDKFSAAGIQTLFSGEYTVTGENDRMGYRLSGPDLEQAPGSDGNIISDGINFGAIQVPKNQPIIMMADRQTTGGYAKIGCVINVDLPLLAQLKAGDKMHFRQVSVAEAQERYCQRHQLLAELERHLNQDSIKRKTESIAAINGVSYRVIVEELPQ